MKRPFIIAVIAVLLGGSFYLALSGYRDYSILQSSKIRSEHEIHLERVGNFSVVAPLSGRSVFRPGGVLEIFLEGNGTAFGDELQGKGTVKVLDGKGGTCLEQDLNGLSVGGSTRGLFVWFPREFDASTSGPYTIQFEIEEPFKLLTGVKQTLSVHYFVCGQEPIIHLTQFGLSALLLIICAMLVRKSIVCKQSSGNNRS